MKQLLILLIFFGFVFAQKADKTLKEFKEVIPFSEFFEITGGMTEKIDKARAKHKELMEKIKVMSTQEKIAYFEKLRIEAQAQMKARVEELSPELKARIEAKMAEIKTNFEKKKLKIDEFKTKIDTKH